MTTSTRACVPVNPVTGGLPYAGDIRLEGMLHAAFVTADQPHTRIVRIDTSAARAVDGVEAVITGADLADPQRTETTAAAGHGDSDGGHGDTNGGHDDNGGGDNGGRGDNGGSDNDGDNGHDNDGEVPRFGRALADYPVLPRDRVLFAGQRIAAVAAVDAATAHHAASLVEVTLEPLEPVLDPNTALADDAPVLHPHYDAYLNARKDRSHPNEQGVELIESGDPDRAFSTCDEVHEHHFAWGRSLSAPLETLTCVVAATNDRVDVYAAHKEPFALRAHLARISRFDEDQIVVHPVTIGGDFGGKGAPLIESICLKLSEATGRPVHARLGWGEVLEATHTRHAGTMRVRSGLRDGVPHAYEAEARLDGGAFAALKPRPSHTVSMSAAMESYEAPHRRLRATTVYTNTVPAGHVRSPGTFQAVFVGESHVDMMARARGEDPLAFRLRAASHPQARRVIEALQGEIADWPRGASATTDGPHDTSATTDSVNMLSGVGVAVFRHGYGSGDTTARAVATTEAVEIAVSTPEQGAGNRRAFRRLAARTLEIPEEHVVLRQADTALGLTDRGVGASRVTAVAGRAIAEACRELIAVLATPLGPCPDPVTSDAMPHLLAPNTARNPAANAAANTAADATPNTAPTTATQVQPVSGYWIADRLATLGRDEVTASARWVVDPQAAKASPLAYGALAIEVSVDVRTGTVVPQRATMVVDAGPVVDPIAHRGQLEGGFVHGLSQTLHEELTVIEGRVATAMLREYGLATAAHAPPLRIRLLDELSIDPDGLDELRSVGELANLGPAPAITNAIHDATGTRITELPLTPERVWRALHGDEQTPQ